MNDTLSFLYRFEQIDPFRFLRLRTGSIPTTNPELDGDSTELMSESGICSVGGSMAVSVLNVNNVRWSITAHRLLHDPMCLPEDI